MLKLLKYLKKHLLFTLLSPLFMIVEVSMDLLVTNVMGDMINKVNSYTTTSDSELFINEIVSKGLSMLLLVLIGVACGVLSGVFANLASQKFGNDLRKDLFKKIMHLSFNQTDDFSTGSLITRVTNDVTTVQMMIAQAIRMFIRSLSMFVLGIIFTLNISINFVIILAVALPLEILLMVIFMKKAFPMFSSLQVKLDKVNSVLHENLTGARVVKAFSKEEFENERFVKANDDLTALNLKVNKLLALLIPLFMLIMYAATIVIYSIGASSQFVALQQSVIPSISVGDTEKAVTYIIMIISSLLMIGMTFASLARAIASAKRINLVLETKDEIVDGKLLLDDVVEKGTITFENVSFSYKEASMPVLDNISFSINQGEVVAIIGATGSGKSTLVNLIARFYDVTSGRILVNSHDVREYKVKDLRNVVAMVLQKAELFHGTIKENILWGNMNASLDEVRYSAQVAQALDYIDNYPEGFDHMIEEKGTNLSGGQRQRVSIARAIIKKPQILIFDDATSALDLVTEAKLYDELDKYLPNTTKILVAQRIATARHATKIIVLDNGKISDIGSHEQLINRSVVYQDIYNSQLKKEGEL